MKENKIQIIKDLNALLNSTRAAEGINLKYGYAERTYSEPYPEDGRRYLTDIVFHESDRILDQPGDPREEVQITWGKQADIYALYQSIEADSGIAIINDLIIAVNKAI